MLHANNVPTFPADNGLPPPTWEVLLDELKPHENSMAKALLAKAGATP